MKLQNSLHQPVALSTLGLLLLSQLLIAIPHATHLPIWIMVLFLGLSGWRWLAATRTWRMPPTWLRIAAIVLGTGGVLLTFGTINGRQAGVALLLVMISLKLLELRTQRDELVVVLLGYFLLLTTFLFHQSIATAVYMLLLALLNTALLISINDPLRPALGRKQLRTGAILFAQGVPLMLVLFILFPRIDGPLWGLSDQSANAVTGLSDSMSPGAFSNLTQSSETAFRVDFKGERPDQSSMYWRGPVFWRYDGWTWRQGGPRGPRRLQFDQLSHPVDYKVTLEPHERLWLFALDVPYKTSTAADFTLDYRIESKRRVEHRMQYDMRSYLGYRIDRNLPEQDRKLALQLPSGRHPKARALAHSWRQQHGDDDAALVGAALQYFRQQPFFYTLSPRLLNEDPVDEFLFDSREGFCEHYAGAFTVLMRAAGIPARVVTGYQGGIWNELGGYFMVRQADAHAWTEVWLQDKGWVRIDPTAAVAPERIRTGLNAGLQNTADLPLVVQSQDGKTWLKPLLLGLDAIQTGWNRWVLGYTSTRQQDLMKGLGLKKFSAADLVRWLVIIVGSILAVIAAGMFLRFHRSTQEPALKAWNKACARLKKTGLERQPHEGPIAYVRRIYPDLKARNPGAEKQLNRIANLYIRLRYGAGNNPEDQLADLARMKKAVARFHP